MSKSKSRIYLILFTTLLAVITLSAFANAEDEAITLTTENFDAAVTKTSGLVPATKPMSGRTAYTKTKIYIGLKKTTDGLAEQVKKKYSYDAELTAKVKKTLNEKLASSLEGIKDRKTFSRKKLSKAATDRRDTLYNAADDDATIGYTKYEDAYYAKIDKAEKDKTSTINQARKSLKKAIKVIKKKAKKKAGSKKAARKKKASLKKARASAKRNFLKAKKEAIKTYKANEKIYDTELENGLNAVDAAYEAQMEKADTIVAKEEQAALAALNTATDKEMDLRGKLKASLQSSINKLSKSTAVIKLGVPNESAGNEPGGSSGKSDKEKAAAKAKAKAKAKQLARYCSKKANKKKKKCSRVY